MHRLFHIIFLFLLLLLPEHIHFWCDYPYFFVFVGFFWYSMVFVSIRHSVFGAYLPKFPSVLGRSFPILLMWEGFSHSFPNGIHVQKNKYFKFYIFSWYASKINFSMLFYSSFQNSVENIGTFLKPYLVLTNTLFLKFLETVAEVQWILEVRMLTYQTIGMPLLRLFSITKYIGW